MAPLVPVRVAYCSLCGLPAEFCEYNTEVPHPSSAGGAQDAPAADAGASAKAKAQKGVAELSLGDGEGAAAGAASDGAAAGDKAEPADGEAPKKKSGGKKVARKQILIERATRNKRKCITTVIGLDLFGIKLADASKKFGKKFACGASVTKDAANKEQIDVQGDFMDEIAEFICKEWKEVVMDDIKFSDKEKK